MPKLGIPDDLSEKGDRSLSSGRISPRRLLDDDLKNIIVRQPSEVSPLEITTPRNEASKDPLDCRKDKHENPFTTPDRPVKTLEGKAGSQVFVSTPPNKGDDDDEVNIEIAGNGSKESCSIENISINELSKSDCDQLPTDPASQTPDTKAIASQFEQAQEQVKESETLLTNMSFAIDELVTYLRDHAELNNFASQQLLEAISS